MKILFVGGSNTMMKKGYAEHFTDIILNENSQNTVKNIAVGANSSVHGLEICALQNDLHEYDTIFVEYMVNDYKLSNNKFFETWCRTYEGILRLLRQKNPNAHIISVLLGRRRDETREKQNKLEDYILYLSKYYKAGVINIDDYLRKLGNNDANAFKAFYSDDSHIRTPLVTEVAGTYVYREWKKIIATPVKSIMGAPLLQPVFDSPNFFSFPEQLAHMNANQDFTNSRMSLTGFKLPRGQDFTLEIKGEPVALTYISVEHSGSLLIEEENCAPILIDTEHASTQNEGLKFILKSFVLPRKTWKRMAASKKIRFYHIPPSDRESLMHVYEREHSMGINPVTAETSNIYLKSIMYI